METESPKEDSIRAPKNLNYEDQICKSQIFYRKNQNQVDSDGLNPKTLNLSRQSQLILRKFNGKDLGSESDFESRIEAQRDLNFLDKLIKMQSKRSVKNKHANQIVESSKMSCRIIERPFNVKTEKRGD